MRRALFLSLCFLTIWGSSLECRGQDYWIYYGDVVAYANGAEAYTFAVVPYGCIHRSELTLERDGQQFESGGPTPPCYNFGSPVQLWVSDYDCLPPYVYYNAYGEVEGELPDYGSFYDFFFDNATTPGPSVIVNSASIPNDNVLVTLSPCGGYGPLTVTVEGTTTHQIGYIYASGGSHNFNFNIPALPNGQEFTTVRAVWEPGSSPVSGTLSYHFKVLGDYLNTRYNTPTESYCSGSLVEIGATTGTCSFVSACTFSNYMGKEQWWSEVYENGSGVSETQGLVSREWFCTGPPRRTRKVPSLCPYCAGMSLIPGATVAVKAEHPDAPCGATLYVDGVGTVTVADTGGDLPLQQLDHYAGFSGCNREGGTIGIRKVVRIY